MVPVRVITSALEKKVRVSAPSLKKKASVLSVARQPPRRKPSPRMAPTEIPPMIAKSFKQKVMDVIRQSSGRHGAGRESGSDFDAEGSNSNSKASTARLDQSGYLAISSMVSHEEMKKFVGRVITDLGFRVTDDGDADLDGMVQYYSGEKDSQTMEKLRQEIQAVQETPGKWITKL